MYQPADGTTERLLTLLDLANAAPSGAGLGADLGGALNEPQVAADIEAQMASIAADLISQEPSVAADINPSPSIAADIEPGSPSIAADQAVEGPSVAADIRISPSITADGPDI